MSDLGGLCASRRLALSTLVRSLVWLWLLVGLGIGCGSDGSNSGEQTPNAVSSYPARQKPLYLIRAQPRLPVMTLWIGDHQILAEIARFPVEMATGMMHRTEMGENQGMLFVFQRPQRASFYMKNTLIPLSGAYIDAEGVILEINDFQPKNEMPVVAKSDQIHFVLESPQGWFESHGIAPGTVIATEKGRLWETFFRSAGP